MSLKNLHLYEEMIGVIRGLEIIEIKHMLNEGLGVKRIVSPGLIGLDTVTSRDQEFLDVVVGLDLEGFYDKDGNRLRKPDDARLYTVGD